MKRKQYSVELIVAALKQAELGMPVADLVRHLGMFKDRIEQSGPNGGLN